MMGTILSIFKMVLPHVENHLGIDSVWGAPRDPSDKIQHWTNTSVGELVVTAQRCDYRLDEVDAVLDQYCEQNRLLLDAIRKHLPAVAAELAMTTMPPAPLRKLSLPIKPITQKFAAVAARMPDADKPSPPPSVRGGHDIELLVAMPRHESVDAGSRAGRLSFAAPQSVRHAAAPSIVRAPSVRVVDDEGGDDDDDAGRYVAMPENDDD